VSPLDAFRRFVESMREAVATQPAKVYENPMVQLWADEFSSGGRRFVRDIYYHGGLDAVPQACVEASKGGVPMSVLLEECEFILAREDRSEQATPEKP
jgi:hypothetical protein